MIRFLHVSDIHLNAGFANKRCFVRKELKDGLYDSIAYAIDYTIENNLEGMIIAGDFFDDDKISFKDEHFVINQFKRILDNGQKLFYVTGNHDPMLTARFLKPLTHDRAFYIFEDDTVTCLDIVSRDGVPYKVIGVGHKSKNEHRNLISNYPVKASDEIWVGVGHASVPTAIDIADKAQYMATSLSQIEALNYNYFALGHIHIRQCLTTKIAYSGNMQGLNIKETGPKGGLLVTLDSKVTKVEPVDFNVIRWEQCDLILNSDINTLSDLQHAIVEQVTSTIESIQTAAKQIIMRMNLSGRSSLKKQLEVDSNCEYLSELIIEKTGLLDFEIKFRNLSNHFNLDALSNEHTILSQMISRISKDAYETALLKKIYDLPIFDDRMTPSEKDSYLKAMKGHLIEEVVDRMVVRSDENK